MKRTLLVSPDGMLGRAWLELLQERGLDFDGVSYPAFDVLDAQSVAQAVEGHDVVLNCSGYTDVDGAEAAEEAATAVNGTGAGNLAAACKAAGSLLVHYSTDYVFDGQATTPYAVDHPIDPVNAYGRSKAAGEAALQASGCEFLLVRTSWLYAPWGKNFVLTMAKLTHELPELKVVDDQHGRPTSAQQLALTTLALIERDARGVFHGTDGGECTWYELASAVRDLTDGSARIIPCTSDAFPRPAKRPAYSVLDISRTESLVGNMVPWRDSLASVLEQR